jgi:hypothetical protein
VKGKAGTSTTPSVNGSLTTHEIAGQPANIANGSPFVQGTLTTWDIADSTVRSADVQVNSLGAADLATGSVNTSEVADNSLGGADVLESSLAKVPAASNADKLAGVAASPVVQLVAAGATDHDRCAEVPPATGVFCTTDNGPTFGVGRWQNLGGIWQPAAFYKDAFGIVHLEGVVWDNFGLNQSRIFILPAGYRPAASHIFVVTGREITDAREAHGRIDVGSDGAVALVIRPDSDGDFGPLAHLSLDGISFRAG